MPTFIAIVQVDSDGRYTASFPDFSECSVSSLTLDEVIKRAREALLQHVEILLEAGQTVHSPTAFDAIQRADALLFAAIEVPDDLGTVHLEIAVPALSLARIESLAGRLGLSLTTLFVKAVDRWAMHEGLARGGEGVGADGPTLFGFATPSELRVEAAAAAFLPAYAPLTGDGEPRHEDGITAELVRLFDDRSGRQRADEAAPRDEADRATDSGRP